MELESLKRPLNYLDDKNIEVTKLVTDRYTQVSACIGISETRN